MTAAPGPLPASGLSRTDLLAALCVVVVWGLNFVAMKVGLRDFTPFQLGAARYLVAAFPLVLLVRRPQVAWRWLLLYGLTQGVGQFGFLFCAMQVGMSAGLASVLLQTQVFITAVLSFVLLGERAGRALQLGLLLACAGLLCFALNYLAPGGGAGATTFWGFVLNLCAAAMWASSNIVIRKAREHSPDMDPLGFVVWSCLVPVLPFAALSWWQDPPELRWHWLQAPLLAWAAVAYLAWMASVLGYALWTRLLQRHPANRVAPFSLGVPVVGLSAGMLLLGEGITPWQWGGITLVVMALACVLGGDGLLKNRRLR